MKIKMKIMICLLVGFIVAVAAVCLAFAHNRHDENVVMKFALYSTGTSDGTHYFELDKSGILKFEYGTSKGNAGKNIRYRNFMEEVRESSDRKLSEEELQTIMDLANAVDFLNYNLKKHIVYGGNYVVFWYKGRVHEGHYDVDRDSIAFTNLMEKFIELSPVPITWYP